MACALLYSQAQLGQQEAAHKVKADAQQAELVALQSRGVCLSQRVKQHPWGPGTFIHFARDQ